ncbi:uncharacterized protein [Asterias amurensis]|uniref:uncharacterized protein isoform X2 n=1 Tax=Asterias amurensis TaxID=7602 RepID=UPI003AB75F2C
MSKKSGSKQSGRRWVHPTTALTSGHVVYNVKLIGNTEVENPKGAEVVREAVRKLKLDTQGSLRKIHFNRQLKRADGEKPAKVELTISTMGVAIQDRQTKTRLHTFPLHRISYCADDKQDKRICAFVCKEEVSNKNVCFVIDSEKCAEEITLTVGQAFDLAYQQFMQTSGKEMGTQKQLLSLQKKVQELETENVKLRMRVVELEALRGHQPPPYSESNSSPVQPPLLKDLVGSSSPQLTPQGSFESMLFQQQNTPPTSGAIPVNASPPTAAAATTGPPAQSPSHISSEAEFLYGSGMAGTTNGVASPTYSSSPGSPQASPIRIRRPRSSTLPSFIEDAGTSVKSRPRPQGLATIPQVPSLAPPPPTNRPRRQTTSASSLIRPDAFGDRSNDPFGQTPFGQNQSPGVARSNPFHASLSHLENSGNNNYQEIQEGFSHGLTIGTEDLSLADLDPLKNLSNC